MELLYLFLLLHKCSYTVGYATDMLQLHLQRSFCNIIIKNIHVIYTYVYINIYIYKYKYIYIYVCVYIYRYI